MSRLFGRRFPFLLLMLICLWMRAEGEDALKQKLDRQYQAAVADYQAGRASDAVTILEQVLPYASASYPVHELIGLAYAALSQNDKAVAHLQRAVELAPNSAEARTNLGTALLHDGKAALAGVQFRKALNLEPNSFDANRNMGEFYVQSGKISEAQPLLQAAYRMKPDSYDNSFDLAMADYLLRQFEEARAVIAQILTRNNTGELHNLLGQIDEKEGKFVAAANEFETAAHLDPSEDNLFDWGSEMLLHRTYEPAIAVFKEGSRRYPKSARILIGLGLSLYSRGIYDEAVKALIAATDVDPADPRAYRFLSKAYDSSPKQAEEVIAAFRRYAKLQPNSAIAQYYYAMSLWKGKRAEDTNVEVQEIEALLVKSIHLDASFADAHLQLGNLYADRHSYDKSIPEYVQALQLKSDLADAHYRLATDYVHVGRKDEAQKEFAVYQKLRAEHLAESDKERSEVQQFVYGERAQNAMNP